MGDQDGGDAGVVEHLAHRPAGGHAQAGVQGGERLVQQHQLRLAGEGAGQGHPLLLPAGELVRAPLGHGGVQGDHLQQFGHPGLHAAVPAGELAGVEAEGDVLPDAQVREQGAVLRHVAHVALVRGHPDAVAGHLGAVERDAAGVRVLKPGDQPQQRGLAGAGRAHDRRRAALGHREVDAHEDGLGAEVLGDGVDFQVAVGAGGHGRGDPRFREPGRAVLGHCPAAFLDCWKRR